MPRTTKHPTHRCSLLLAFAMAVPACWDHELYDGKVNRFDTYYLGGGNSSTRPFRSARVDPDAGFALDLIARSERDDDALVLTALLLDTPLPDSVGGTLYWRGDARQEIARFVFDGGESLALELPWRRVAPGLDAGDELEAEFVDENGGTVILRFTGNELREALGERRGGDR